MTDPSMTRKSNGLDLTPETQAEIWQSAKYESADGMPRRVQRQVGRNR